MPGTRIRRSWMLLLLTIGTGALCGSAGSETRQAAPDWTPGCPEVPISWSAYAPANPNPGDLTWIPGSDDQLFLLSQEGGGTYQPGQQSGAVQLHWPDGVSLDLGVGNVSHGRNRAIGSTIYVPIMRPGPTVSLEMLEIDIVTRAVVNTTPLDVAPWGASCDAWVKQIGSFPDGSLGWLIIRYEPAGTGGWTNRQGYLCRYDPVTHLFDAAVPEVDTTSLGYVLPDSDRSFVAFTGGETKVSRINLETGAVEAVEPGAFPVMDFPPPKTYPPWPLQTTSPYIDASDPDVGGTMTDLGRHLLNYRKWRPLREGSWRAKATPASGSAGAANPQSGIAPNEQEQIERDKSRAGLPLAEYVLLYERDTRIAGGTVNSWSNGAWVDLPLPQEAIDAADWTQAATITSGLYPITLDGSRLLIRQLVYPTPSNINDGNGLLRLGIADPATEAFEWLLWTPLPAEFHETSLQPEMFFFVESDGLRIGFSAHNEDFMGPGAATGQWGMSLPWQPGLSRSDFPWADGTKLNNYS